MDCDLQSRNNWLIDFYKDEDVYLVGSGPSLENFPFVKLKNKNVIAINHSYNYVKHDILVFYDSSFLTGVKKRGHDIYNMKCKIITGRSSGLKLEKNIFIFNMAGKPSMNPAFLFGNFQSGLIALNAAILSGAKRIFLLGFDCTFENGKCHFYHKECNHPKDFKKFRYEKAAELFNKFHKFRDKIYNCSNISIIKTFQRFNLNDII